MTDRQLGKILEAVRAGKTLADGLRAARLSRERYEKAIAEDPELDEIIQAAFPCPVTSEAPPKAPPEPEQLEVAPPPPPPPEPVREPEQLEVAPPAPPQPVESKPPTIVIVPPEPVAEEPEPESFKLNKEKVFAEAAELGGGMYGLVLWVDHKCMGYGMPGLSEWWKYALSGFYNSGKRWFIGMVGRGGGKSTSFTRVAGAEGMFTDRIVPPGQRWIWPFISVGLDDATRRIIEIEQVLRSVGLDPEVKRPSGRPTIELQDINGQNIAFVSLASTISGVSGPSGIGVTLDEEAKLKDRAKNANPSTEIIASAAQTFRARPNIHGFRISSAWMMQGSHYESVTEGDTSASFVARIGERFLPRALDGLHEVAEYEAMLGSKSSAEKIRAYAKTLTANSPNVPTWVANPTISAIASRLDVAGIPIAKLGGISRAEYWLRENASLPLAGGASYSAGDMRALVDMNRRLNNPDRDGPTGRLITFDGLSELDPRSSKRRRRGAFL